MADELREIREHLSNLRVSAATIEAATHVGTKERERLFQIGDDHERRLRRLEDGVLSAASENSGRSWAFGKVVAALAILGSIIGTCGGFISWLIGLVFRG